MPTVLPDGCPLDPASARHGRIIGDYLISRSINYDSKSVVVEPERSLTAHTNLWRKFSSAWPNRCDRLLHCMMSAYGTRRTCRDPVPMSAFGGKADMPQCPLFPRKRTWFIAKVPF